MPRLPRRQSAVSSLLFQLLKPCCVWPACPGRGSNHSIAPDGVYVRDADTGKLRFHPLATLRHEHVVQVATRTAAKMRKVLKAHGRFDEHDRYVHNCRRCDHRGTGSRQGYQLQSLLRHTRGMLPSPFRHLGFSLPAAPLGDGLWTAPQLRGSGLVLRKQPVFVRLLSHGNGVGRGLRATASRGEGTTRRSAVTASAGGEAATGQVCVAQGGS